MAGLGDTLRRQYQARQMGDALLSLRDPLADLAERTHALTPGERAIEEAYTAKLNALLGGRAAPAGAGPWSGDAQPAAGGGRQLLATMLRGSGSDLDEGRQREVVMRGHAPPEPSPDDMELILRGALPGAPRITRVPQPASVAAGPPSVVSGGVGGGAGGVSPAFAALLKPAQTRGEWQRKQAMLQPLMALLDAETQMALKRELEAGRIARAQAKEAGTERRHRENIESRENIAGGRLGLDKDKLAELSRHDKEMERLRGEANRLLRAAQKRALSKQERDQAMQLASQYNTAVSNFARLGQIWDMAQQEAAAPLMDAERQRIEELRPLVDDLLKAVGKGEMNKRGVTPPAASANVMDEDAVLDSLFGVK